MDISAQPEKCERRRSAAEQRGIQQPLTVASGNGDGERQREQRKPGPLRRMQRAIQERLQRVVQRYFPFMPKNISIRPRRMRKATAVAMGP